MIWAYHKRKLCWKASAHGWRAEITRVPERHAYRAVVEPFNVSERAIHPDYAFHELGEAQRWCLAEIERRSLAA